MFTLIVLMLLLGVVLAVLVTGWSMWFQSAIYTEPATGLVWRGPAAAGVLLFVVLVWVVLAYRSPGRYRPLWESASTEQATQFEELRVPGEGDREEVYRRRPGKRNEYRLNGLPSGKPMPSTPNRIVAVEGEKRYTFEPERDDKGKFKRRKGGAGEEPLRYVDKETGRIMTEGALGEVEVFRAGVFVGNLVLNVVFVAAAFLGLWLLVRFQWLHALGQAVVLSLLLLLFVMPQLLTRTETVARERAAARAPAPAPAPEGTPEPEG